MTNIRCPKCDGDSFSICLTAEKVIIRCQSLKCDARVFVKRAPMTPMDLAEAKRELNAKFGKFGKG